MLCHHQNYFSVFWKHLKLKIMNFVHWVLLPGPGNVANEIKFAMFISNKEKHCHSNLFASLLYNHRITVVPLKPDQENSTPSQYYCLSPRHAGNQWKLAPIFLTSNSIRLDLWTMLPCLDFCSTHKRGNMGAMMDNTMYEMWYCTVPSTTICINFTKKVDWAISYMFSEISNQGNIFCWYLPQNDTIETQNINVKIFRHGVQSLY